MNTLLKDRVTLFPPSPTPHCTILYDDFACGLRGSRFASMLADRFGVPHEAPALWRCELLRNPALAAEATRYAAASDFVIFSLLGDLFLSSSTCRWVESWLNVADGGRTCLVALFRAGRSNRDRVSGSWTFLRRAARSAGVDFLACGPGDEARENPFNVEESSDEQHGPEQRSRVELASWS